MTKWQCRCEKHWCRVETSGVTPDSCLYDRHTNPRWKRVDEPPLKDAPPFKQDDEHEPRVRVWLGDQHERDIQEMAGNLAALKERIDKGEGRLCAIVTDLDERVKKLEHQMRNHYHSGNVWVESEDGSESVMQ
ncbi:MAG: hypothetical protein BWY93_02029 [Euryarchaeota archaeon ADurb.BinA087]|nr:MAG: hypothetical protein BWY93_02029 [Euryarchaeota archaeon ADurb.BinA087]